MKNKLFIGTSVDTDVGNGNIITWSADEVQSISHSDNGWELISVDGCVYDLYDLQVIEGVFTLRDPLPTDSKS